MNERKISAICRPKSGHYSLIAWYLRRYQCPRGFSRWLPTVKWSPSLEPDHIMEGGWQSLSGHLYCYVLTKNKSKLKENPPTWGWFYSTRDFNLIVTTSTSIFWIFHSHSNRFSTFNFAPFLSSLRYKSFSTLYTLPPYKACIFSVNKKKIISWQSYTMSNKIQYVYE
jgi:hypothetical protein